MDPRLFLLLEKARHVRMTDAERQVQRLSFAYGNTHLENASITRETVRRASEKLRGEHEQGYKP